MYGHVQSILISGCTDKWNHLSSERLLVDPLPPPNRLKSAELRRSVSVS